MKRLALCVLLALVIPACSENHDSGITQVTPPTGGTISVPVQLVTVEHEGHIYVVGIFGSNGGAILHSPNCPFDKILPH